MRVAEEKGSEVDYNTRLVVFMEDILTVWENYSKFWNYRQQVYAYNQIYDISRGVMA